MTNFNELRVTLNERMAGYQRGLAQCDGRIAQLDDELERMRVSRHATVGAIEAIQGLLKDLPTDSPPGESVPAQELPAAA